jgi:hypothetical protein
VRERHLDLLPLAARGVRNLRGWGRMTIADQLQFLRFRQSDPSETSMIAVR